MGHWFAEHGVAALAYDKRGVNESTRDFRRVAFTDLAPDGLAAVAVLRARADIDPGRIGVWGLSQGGWLGPLAASQSKDVAFVIAVSGPGVGVTCRRSERRSPTSNAGQSPCSSNTQETSGPGIALRAESPPPRGRRQAEQA